MIKKEIEITTRHGLHLRVAAKIVQANNDSKAKIIFSKDGQTADASSILELLLFRKNTTLMISYKQIALYLQISLLLQ